MKALREGSNISYRMIKKALYTGSYFKLTEIPRLFFVLLLLTSNTANSIECDPELITDPAVSRLIETTPSYFDDCVALKEKLALLVQQYDWSRFEELYTGDELDYLKERYLEHNSLEWVTMHLVNMSDSAFDDEVKRVNG